MCGLSTCSRRINTLLFHYSGRACERYSNNNIIHVNNGATTSCCYHVVGSASARMRLVSPISRDLWEILVIRYSRIRSFGGVDVHEEILQAWSVRLSVREDRRVAPCGVRWGERAWLGLGWLYNARVLGCNCSRLIIRNDNRCHTYLFLTFPSNRLFLRIIPFCF